MVGVPAGEDEHVPWGASKHYLFTICLELLHFFPHEMEVTRPIVSSDIELVAARPDIECAPPQ